MSNTEDQKIEESMANALRDLCPDEMVEGKEGINESLDPNALKGMLESLSKAFEQPALKVTFIKTNENAIIPAYQTTGSSGFDLHCIDNFTIGKGQTLCVDTGLKVANIPDGIELQIRPRSGLAAKKSITVLNTPGTIDTDYRGNLLVILINLGNVDQEFKRGDRIAQAVANRYERVLLEEVQEEDLVKTDRGDGGLGSTGA